LLGTQRYTSPRLDFHPELSLSNTERDFYELETSIADRFVAMA
jgi:hypothetical protein